jgi:hypothetical protein
MPRPRHEQLSDPWPSEIARAQAIRLACARLRTPAAATPDQAWRVLVPADDDQSIVAAWYRRAARQISAGRRCQQRWCFERDWRRLQTHTA